MYALITNAAFWAAIASLAWPIVVLIVLLRFKPLVEGILKRENMTIKVAGMELSVQAAAKGLGRDIGDLQERIAKLEGLNPLNDSPPRVENNDSNIKVNEDIILWVDDFPSNNAFIVENLRNKGVEVVLSLNTQDALKRLGNSKFSSIITDLGRVEGGMENQFAGLDLIKEVRAAKIEIPILVFAGRRGMQHKGKLLAAGADDVTSSGVDVLAFIEKHSKRYV